MLWLLQSWLQKDEKKEAQSKRGQLISQNSFIFHQKKVRSKGENDFKEYVIFFVFVKMWIAQSKWWNIVAYGLLINYNTLALIELSYQNWSRLCLWLLIHRHLLLLHRCLIATCHLGRSCRCRLGLVNCNVLTITSAISFVFIFWFFSCILKDSVTWRLEKHNSTDRKRAFTCILCPPPPHKESFFFNRRKYSPFE